MRGPSVCAVALGVVTLVACNNSSGPVLYFPIGGTYTGTITYQMVGDAPLSTPLVPGIAVTLDDPDNNGNFGGDFFFSNGYTDTGDVAAQFTPDGEEINWEQFGDPGQPLFYIQTFMSANYPICNFDTASMSLNENGGFDGNGNLFLTGTYTGIVCLADMSGDSVNTTLNVSLSVYNPYPSARPPHPVGVASHFGRVQHVHPASGARATAFLAPRWRVPPVP
jgi:hypothetical protein